MSAPHRLACSVRLRSVGRLAAALLGAALVVFAARPAAAQETTGRIVGLVTDEATHTPQVGVTVILQGSQGEDASLTDDRGEYTFVNLTVGTYTVRFYNATSSTNVERHDLAVSAGATLRADVVIPSQPAAQETYVIKRKAAAVDVGSARLGLTLDPDFMTNLALDRTFGDLVLKAPGAFIEPSGGVSIAGASGLENTYVTDGLNVTGMEYGDIMNKRADATGGSNLTLDFVKELQISTGGYRAEFGGAMGGVVNVVTKSGTNDLHGSAFMYWAPYWLAGDPKLVDTKGSVLSGVDKPDYDMNVGFEVGGPIVKDKAFFWVGFAPRLEKSHFFRDVSPLVEGANGTSTTGDVVLRTRSRELRQSYQYGVKLDFVPTPDHKLTLSLFGTPTASEHVRGNLNGEEADNDPRWAMQSLHKNNTDVTATWMSQLLERRLRLDASVGLHRETLTDQSPYADLNALNQREYHGFSLYSFEQIAGCQPTTSATTGTVFDPCPVGSNGSGYHTGGYGQVKSFTGNRWMADVKATALLNKNELKAGAHLELNTFDQNRYYSGPVGGRSLVLTYPDYTQLWSFFTVPKGKYASQYADGNGTDDPNMDGKVGDLYQDNLVASVKSVNTAYFLQDTYHPLPNLSIDLGLRYENQRMYDFRGTEFLNTDNLGPRLGVVFDPSNDGRSKVFASFGQFFETVPMNLAARYFGGEGIFDRIYATDSCRPPVTQWQGTGNEAQTSNCKYLFPYFINAGAPYPTQSHMQGQHHNEILAGFQHALSDDLVVGMSYTHRWLGSIIEDGSPGPNLPAALGNPGDVPQAAKDEVQHEIDAKAAELAAPQTQADPAAKALTQAQLDTLKGKLNALQVLGTEPKPERTYDALTLTANKRLGHSWYFQGSYTYSRLIGNYNGLYDADSNYFAPNGGTAYDSPDLVLNKRGPLANDRPHSGHVDAFYQLPVGRGVFTGGLSFAAYSGVPRNYVGALIQGQQLVFLLPRGSAGRTPSVYQVDAKIGYKQQLTKTTALELFFDLFNLLNSRTTLLTDDNYTTDSAAAIVNGNQNDLAHAKNSAGLPIQKNPNFGNPTAFQAPIHGRMGLRFLF
jgi:hypothetical protein